MIIQRIKNELRKRIKNLKQNLSKLSKSRKEAKNYSIYIDNKQMELEKLKAGNELFKTIRADLEEKKRVNIEEYEIFYKKAQESSKGKNNY